MFPFSKEEPNLTPEELQRLDAIADMIEVKRLKSMQVLADTTEIPADHKFCQLVSYVRGEKS